MTAAPPTSELAAFLTRMLDADEAAARAATEGPWWIDFGGEYGNKFALITGILREPYGDNGLNCGQDHDTAQHIARHDPARVLAQVAALRAVVEKAKWAIDVEGGGAEDFADFTLRHVAAIWADHEAFDPAWSA